MAYAELQIIEKMCGPTADLASSVTAAISNSQLTIYALITSVVILALFYIYGTLFRNSQFNAFVKFEFFEVLMSGVISIFLIMLLANMCSFKVGYLFPSSAHSGQLIWEDTLQYFLGAKDFILGWLSANFFIASAADQMASTTIYAKPLGMGVVTSPMAGLGGPIKQILYQILNALSISMVIVQAQILVLLFMFYGYVKYYFPIGILLRSFTPTRRFGGSIIAIGIGFLIIFPLLTVINFEMVDDMLTSTDKNIWDAVTSQDSKSLIYQTGALQDASKLTGGTKDIFFKSDGVIDGDQTTYGKAGENSGLLDIVYSVFQSSSKIPGWIMLQLLKVPFEAVTMAFVAAFLLPAINLIILAQAIKSLSKILGEEVDISILTRLI